MATSNYPFCFISLFAITTLLCPLSSHAQYFFIFGDSLYDPGNNQYITPEAHIPAYYSPYGSTFFDHATGRFSDGRIVADFIAVKLNLPFIPPALDPNGDFTHGASFASAGAGVLDTNPEAMYFGAQVDAFQNLTEKWIEELGEDEANLRLNSAVYLISIGGDDYFAFLDENCTTLAEQTNCTVAEQEKFVAIVLSHFIPQVERIYNLGGRKFMFQNVAPMGCLPMWKQNFNLTGYECAGKPLRQAELHNAALVNVLKEVQDNLTGFRYSIFNYYHAMGQRIDNPTDYGFKKGDVACCGTGTHLADSCGDEAGSFELCFNPDEYVWFDGGHNTDHANHEMAELMWSGGVEYVAPFTMKQLFELEPTANPTSATTSSSKKSLLRLCEK